MKKGILVAVAILIIAIGGFLGARALLFPKPDVPVPSADLTAPGVVDEPQGADDAGELPDEAQGPVRAYDNGLASFTYDSTKLVFQEMPSADESGYSMTSFLVLDSDDVLPRVDVMPLVMDEAIPETLPESDWQSLAKTLILAYYNAAEHGNVVIDISSTVVKVDGNSAKLYVGFTTTLDGSETPNMSGAVRMTTNGTNAVITLALAEKGTSVPQEMYDLYMSAVVH